jgi:hypothetical protein
MTSKVIIFLTKENALNQVKIAKTHMDISKLQLLCKTKNGKYAISGVYEFKGELIIKGSSTMVDSIESVAILD